MGRGGSGAISLLDGLLFGSIGRVRACEIVDPPCGHPARLRLSGFGFIHPCSPPPILDVYIPSPTRPSASSHLAVLQLLPFRQSFPAPGGTGGCALSGTSFDKAYELAKGERLEQKHRIEFRISKIRTREKNGNIFPDHPRQYLYQRPFSSYSPCRANMPSAWLRKKLAL